MQMRRVGGSTHTEATAVALIPCKTAFLIATRNDANRRCETLASPREKLRPAHSLSDCFLLCKSMMSLCNAMPRVIKRAGRQEDQGETCRGSRKPYRS